MRKHSLVRKWTSKLVLIDWGSGFPRISPMLVEPGCGFGFSPFLMIMSGGYLPHLKLILHHLLFMGFTYLFRFTRYSHNAILMYHWFHKQAIYRQQVLQLHHWSVWLWGPRARIHVIISDLYDSWLGLGLESDSNHFFGDSDSDSDSSHHVQWLGLGFGLGLDPSDSDSWLGIDVCDADSTAKWPRFTILKH